MPQSKSEIDRRPSNGNSVQVVYVTGCLGFIGRHVASVLLEHGFYVYGIDKCTYAADKRLLDDFHRCPRFRFDELDINDLDRLVDCDYVVNVAAETHVDNSIVNSADFIHSNVNGVHRLLELLRTKSRFSIPVLLHFSTDEVYGPITEGVHTEKDLLRPGNPYSASKASADMLIQAWHNTYNVPYIILRPTNNYGIGQYVEKLIPKACKMLGLGKRMPLHEGGSPRRTWLHAADTAQAVLSVIQAGVRNQIYNVSGDKEDANLNVFRKIVRCYHGTEDVDEYADFGYKRTGQDVRYGIDDSKLRALGWSPKHDFDDDLPKIVEYYRKTFVW